MDMEKILTVLSGVLVVFLAASAIYSWVAGQDPVISLAAAVFLLILLGIRAVYRRTGRKD